MTLLQKFKENARKQGFFGENQTTLFAASGGIDSTVAAHLMAGAGFRFALAHCNFRLRGDESEGDAAFVADLGQRLGVPFFTKAFDTQAFARENGLSVQVAARNLRYEWFEEIRAAEGFDCIATAHNLDDSAETTLFNLVRGTGIAGLQGIPARNGRIVRPLLFATRAEIEAFAREQSIQWHEDSSNASDDYARNFMRHQVVPRLLELNPNLQETIARMQGRLRDLEANFEQLAALVRPAVFQPENDGYRIDKEALARFPAPGSLLLTWLDEHGFEEEQARQWSDFSSAKIGQEWVAPDGWRLLNDRSALLLSPPGAQNEALKIGADDLMLRLPDGSRLVLMQSLPAPPYPDGRESILADADKIRFPLTLRPWQAGDVFQPLGLQGRSQKLQDFFTNLKLSRHEKNRVWVLENGSGEIIWVLGHRLDERFKILPETTTALKIAWLQA